MARHSQVFLKSYVKTNHIDICKFRSECRICKIVIEHGDLRFCEMYQNPLVGRFGYSYYNYHMTCAVNRMPECFFERLDTNGIDFSQFVADIIFGFHYPKLAEIHETRPARITISSCKQCNTCIMAGEWLIHLKKFAEGKWNDKGFIHIACMQAYTGITDKATAERLMKNVG